MASALGLLGFPAASLMSAALKTLPAAARAAPTFSPSAVRAVERAASYVAAPVNEKRLSSMPYVPPSPMGFGETVRAGLTPFVAAAYAPAIALTSMPSVSGGNMVTPAGSYTVQPWSPSREGIGGLLGRLWGGAPDASIIPAGVKYGDTVPGLGMYTPAGWVDVNADGSAPVSPFSGAGGAEHYYAQGNQEHHVQGEIYSPTTYERGAITYEASPNVPYQNYSAGGVTTYSPGAFSGDVTTAPTYSGGDSGYYDDSEYSGGSGYYADEYGNVYYG